MPALVLANLYRYFGFGFPFTFSPVGLRFSLFHCFMSDAIVWRTHSILGVSKVLAIEPPMKYPKVESTQQISLPESPQTHTQPPQGPL